MRKFTPIIIFCFVFMSVACFGEVRSLHGFPHIQIRENTESLSEKEEEEVALAVQWIMSDPLKHNNSDAWKQTVEKVCTQLQEKVDKQLNATILSLSEVEKKIRQAQKKWSKTKKAVFRLLESQLVFSYLFVIKSKCVQERREMSTEQLYGVLLQSLMRLDITSIGKKLEKISSDLFELAIEKFKKIPPLSDKSDAHRVSQKVMILFAQFLSMTYQDAVMLFLVLSGYQHSQAYVPQEIRKLTLQEREVIRRLIDKGYCRRLPGPIV